MACSSLVPMRQNPGITTHHSYQWLALPGTKPPGTAPSFHMHRQDVPLRLWLSSLVVCAVPSVGSFPVWLPVLAMSSFTISKYAMGSRL